MKYSIIISNIFILSSLLFSNLGFAESQLLTVSVKPLSSILIDSKQSSPASVVSLNTAVVSAEITGRAIKIYAEVGDEIQAKEKLVRLDCRSYDLARKQAQASLKVSTAQLNLARKQLARNKQLLSQGTIPRELYDNAVASQQTSLADIEFKKAQIETTKLAINRCTITAPFSGQITERMVQQGQLVLPGSALFQLMQSNNMEVKAKLSPSDVSDLKDLSLIEFVTADQRYKLSVRSVIQRVDQTTRTQEVRLRFAEGTAPKNLAEGLSGRVEWSNKSLKIPPEFVLRNNNELGVMIASKAEEGTAKAKFQTLKNAVEGQPATSTLPLNTLIIDKNRFRVNDGQIINIQN